MVAVVEEAPVAVSVVAALEAVAVDHVFTELTRPIVCGVATMTKKTKDSLHRRSEKTSDTKDITFD